MVFSMSQIILQALRIYCTHKNLERVTQHGQSCKMIAAAASISLRCAREWRYGWRCRKTILFSHRELCKLWWIDASARVSVSVSIGCISVASSAPAFVAGLTVGPYKWRSGRQRRRREAHPVVMSECSRRRYRRRQLCGASFFSVSATAAVSDAMQNSARERLEFEHEPQAAPTPQTTAAVALFLHKCCGLV